MNTSGDLFIAFSTANSLSFGDTSLQEYSFLPNELLNPVFTATVQATEEAIVNSLVAARTMVGNEGHKIFEMPHERVKEILRRHRRLIENN
jgi:L-aminopeptidase/D-esterase-like protein